jgi:hypothetical protein
MNANRKADLQRKLTLVPIPKPPAGLAERIKREIPKELRFNVEEERERLSRAVAFNLRVAASILILVSSAYLGLQMLSNYEKREPAALQAPIAARVQPRAVPETPPQSAAKLDKQQPLDDVREEQARSRKAKVRALNEVRRAPAPAAVPVPEPPPPAPAVAESIYVSTQAPAVAADQAAPNKAASGLVLDRVDQQKSAAAKKEALDGELTTSPVSGKEMFYSSRDKKLEVLAVSPKFANATRKVDYDEAKDRKLVPWAKVSRETKLKILEAELAAGGDKKTIARVAREAGLKEFADSIEKP